MATWINQLSETEKQQLKENVKEYQNALKKENVTDFGLLRAEEPITAQTLLLTGGLLPFVVGYAANYLPLRLGKFMGNKFAAHITFYSSITAVSGMVFWFFYFLIVLLISGLANFPLNIYLAVAIAILLPLLGYFALFYQHQFRYWRAVRQAQKLSPSCRKELLHLRPKYAP